MRYLKLMLAGLLFLSLVACMQSGQPLEGAKSLFQKGDFKAAFRDMLPLAVKGDPDAQYAVGYMYYYGIGAPQDSVSGLFWINKAALAHNGSAATALALIQKNAVAVQQPDPNPAVSPDNQKPALVTQQKTEDALFKAPIVKRAPPVRTYKDNAQKTSSFAEPVSHYTLQLFGSYTLAAAHELQTSLASHGRTHITKTVRDGKDWYILTTGQYSTITEAKTALHQLPPALANLKPWIKQQE